jgi:hypothetical protein
MGFVLAELYIDIRDFERYTRLLKLFCFRPNNYLQ